MSETAMRETKIDRVAGLALARVMAGCSPDVAWVDTLRELYSAEAFANQVRHSCPKWAFSILCHECMIHGVRPGCCPAAEGLRSSAYTLTALDLLRADPSL